ncbi:molybdenum cofactor biosynthesis domain-containing protein [Roseivivax marinus]|uniref:Molybdenum cofactor biosynthesis domain-containing protein n=1 Tax=Roseivivax marinus TaxID=1379903 RepID=W4HIZ4_9RHOB|nr:molybdopterin-binding protein [Roseivivax marinus]ETW12121.1 molybdenum cofactor biosynthesis domain-containing protein [Roseivivax marinus]
MPNPTAAMLVIGDEILSGRTRDANLHHLSQQFTAAGIDLKEARIVSDDHDAIVAAVDALRETHDILVTSGGIGPTHDDITADAVAAAFGVHIDVREDAKALMEARYAKTGRELNEARLRMARIPDGAELIENDVSAAPGFRIGNVYVMAGVPSVFTSMLDRVLPTLNAGTPLMSQSIRVERAEGDIAGPLRDLAREFDDLAFGSYPFSENGVYGANVVVRGTDSARLNEAATRLHALFS